MKDPTMKLEAKQRLMSAPVDQMTLNYLMKNSVGKPYLMLFHSMKNQIQDKYLEAFGLALKLMDDGTDEEEALGQVYLGNGDKDLKKAILHKLNSSTHQLLAMKSLTLEKWKAEVKRVHPKAVFTIEDGSGKTYGEKGDWTAHTGKDMQADIVGVYTNSYCWVSDKDGEFDEYDVTASISNPLNDGAAFETLIDGDPSDKKPVVQEFTDNDGGISPFDENLLLQDDIQYRLS
jgi:hypothetical protein